MPDAEDIIFCTVPIPGPPGPAGADGTDGTNGNNAYTTTTASFIMPGEGDPVTISVASSAWMVVGQVLAIRAGASFGHFFVLSTPTSTSVEIENVENTTDGTYLSNSAPGTTFASGARVSPAGLQGPTLAPINAAPLDATYITQTPNGTLTNEQSLSGLATGLLLNTTGTGVLTIAADGTDYLSPTTGLVKASNLSDLASAATARTNLGLAIGTNVQAYDATLQSISSLGTAADRYAYTTGVDTWTEGAITNFARTLLDDADAATMRTTLGVSTTGLAMLLYQHRVSGAGGGGAFSAGAWRTVPLNTEVVDTGGNGSITSNEITLAAGTYRFRFGVIGYSVGLYKGRIWNVTDGSVQVNTDGSDTYGSVADAALVGANVASISEGQGRFTLSGSKTIRLEARCSTTNGTDGFGEDASTLGGDDVFSWLELFKE